MSDVKIIKKDETHIILSGEESVLYEIRDLFTFYAEGYKFHPKYKAKLWDGKIMLLRLSSKNRGEIYHGLLHDIITFCENRGYSYELDKSLLEINKLSTEEIKKFLEYIKPSFKGEIIDPRDYQIKGFVDSICNKRNLNLSVTSSGKSFIIYMIIRYLNKKGLKGLIITPNVSLVHQLYSDFEEYSKLNGWVADENIHKIYSGQDKISKKQIYQSTWQSLQNIKEKLWFEQFDYVIVDEAHGCKATQLTSILEKCINASYRLGFTGTIDEVKANINTLKGLFGSINKLNTTKELIDKGQISNFNIKCLVLKYDEETAKAVKKFKYQEEIKYLISNPKRNNFIKNLALSLDNNTIILFNFVETHGKVIYELLLNSKHRKGRNIYFIHGGVAGEEREQIRQIMETEKNAIIVGSSSIMSTGISIKNLHNIIFAISGKSRIRNLQSIGRVLRLHKEKEIATLYDIADNLSTGKHKNYTLLHFLERVKTYNKEQFEYKLINVDFKQ